MISKIPEHELPRTGREAKGQASETKTDPTGGFFHIVLVYGADSDGMPRQT
jgi:hypothetical protein